MEPHRQYGPTGGEDSEGFGITGSTLRSETIELNVHGHRFRRLEIELGGAVRGWVPESGEYAKHLTDVPDVVIVQQGANCGYRPARGHYELGKGSGLSVFLPENAAHWNGRMFFTVHGSMPYGRVGALAPRDSRRKFQPLLNANKFVGLMIDKGFAVAHSRRMAAPANGDGKVTVEGAGAFDNGTFVYHTGLLIPWIRLAMNLVKQRLGEAPKLYFYGHSAGGMVGRVFNYGFIESPVRFDGFLLDDSGNGLWMPERTVEGKDVILATGDKRARFAPQIDLVHQAYVGRGAGINPVSTQRRNARLLQEKGVGEKHRIYEVRGLSHFDAGFGPEDMGRGRDAIHQNLDSGGIIEALIDRLVEWVERNAAPPPSKSDDTVLGDADKDGVNENPAIALPEIACPLGVYYPYPPELGDARVGRQTMAFSAFDGTSLEPLDGRGNFVDMNGSGRRDVRETVTQAWRRLGLLNATESFGRNSYEHAIRRVALNLAREGILPMHVAEYYIENARHAQLPDS
jgi:Alpha/beta hydrolase domain